MNEVEKFALVPRPSGALEKAEPGTKRVLAGMVQDALSLARTKYQVRRIPALSHYTRADLENWFHKGESYLKGEGVPQDFAEAVAWYRKAADQGHAEAQISLWRCYQHGYGVPKDYAEAVKWGRKGQESYRKVAEQGDLDVLGKLALLYDFRAGVPEGYDEIVKCRLAAEHGDPSAQCSLAVCYMDGSGVARDYCEAYKWFKLCAEQDKYAAEKLAWFSSTMTPGQVKEGEQRYLEFKQRSSKYSKNEQD
jgi:TPR repeat protein